MSEAATSANPAPSAGNGGDPLLEVRDLVKHFPIRQGLLQRQVGAVRAVDGVTFDVLRGETLGLVGESGCGKSTTARLVLRLMEPTSGSIRFEGEEIAGLKGAPLKELRRGMQMIFQDPYSSLNPRKTVGTIISEPFVIHGLAKGEGERKRTVQELMDRVGLNPEHYNRYPHEFSGGQRQRIGVARALALQPKVIVADEPVSALDVSIQAQILNLLRELQREMGITLIFIAHDLSVVRHMCDRIAVMYLGKVVELATNDQLYRHPRMPYTGALDVGRAGAAAAAGRRQEAPGAGGRRAVSGQPAARLPLPHPLLEGAGDLPPGGAAAGGQGRAATSPPATSRSRTPRCWSGCLQRRSPSQARQALVPLGAHGGHPVDRLRQRGGSQRVAGLATLAACGHEARAGERMEVLGDRLPRHRQLAGQPRRGEARLLGERAQDLAARGVCERSEDLVQAGHSAAAPPAR